MTGGIALPRHRHRRPGQALPEHPRGAGEVAHQGSRRAVGRALSPSSSGRPSAALLLEIAAAPRPPAEVAVRLAHPQLLWLLLLVPALVLAYAIAFVRRRRALSTPGQPDAHRAHDSGHVGAAQGGPRRAAVPGGRAPRPGPGAAAGERPGTPRKAARPRPRGGARLLQVDAGQGHLPVAPRARQARARAADGSAVRRPRGPGGLRRRNPDLSADHRLRRRQALLARPVAVGHAGRRHGHRPRPDRRDRDAVAPARRRRRDPRPDHPCCSPTARTRRASRSTRPSRRPSSASRSSPSVSAHARASWCPTSARARRPEATSRIATAST